MARKTTVITISDDGRDKGKKFRINEPPCYQIDNMVTRAVFGLGRAGVTIPAEIIQLGAAPTAYFIGTQFNKLPWRLGLQLADELMACVQRVETKLDRSLVEEDIEELTTRLKLKGEVLKLIFGFFAIAASQTSGVAAVSDPPQKP